MSIRGIGDGYAVQRLLWLLVGTVIAPTILLALYGVSAIRNQNAWVRQQARQVQQVRLQDAASALFGDIGTLDGRVHALAEQCIRGRNAVCTAPDPRIAEVWVWPIDDGPPPALSAVGVPLVGGMDTVWFSPSDGGDAIGTFKLKGHQVAWQVRMAALQERLEGWSTERFDDGMTVVLTGASAGPLTPMAEMREAWAEPQVDLLLERPLLGSRLLATYPGLQNPAVTLVGQTVWVSPLALGLLVGLVLAGAVVTLGSAAREIRLSRLQTDFVSNVSHELRTPLTSIRMFVETLQSGRIDDPEKVTECLDLLALETERLSRMIERVLNWARMEAGRRTYEIETVTARSLVSDALVALRSQHLLSNDVDIEVTLPSDLPSLQVDRDAIVEALLNLLQNAIKHTPEPRRIQVQAATERGRVGLAVVDNGPGIAKADQSRVFEKFYQANPLLSSPARRGAERGSGLGLSIVRAVARGHGGRVDLDTELGRGCRFTLWLPAAEAR